MSLDLIWHDNWISQGIPNSSHRTNVYNCIQETQCPLGVGTCTSSLASHLPACKPEKGTIQSPTTHQYISTSHQKNLHNWFCQFQSILQEIMVLKLKSWSQLEMKLWNQKNPDTSYQPYQPLPAKARHNFWREVVEPLPNGFQFPTRIQILINLHFGLTLATTICRLLLLLFPHLPNVESVFNQSNDAQSQPMLNDNAK